MAIKFKDLSPEEQQDYRDRMRHSAAHVLAEAVTKLFPESQLTIGPPIKDGFYYDFAVPEPFTPDDLKKIELEMRESIRANTEFVERKVSRDEALELVKDNPYKIEILEGIPADEQVTFCSHANGTFEDLCRGGHMERTGDIKAYKLLSAAGAYWRGDEKNAMLQRIYGTAWESRDAQKEYLKLREEAEKRDHRKLGRALGLYFFDPIAPASPFFLPKGTVVLNQMIDYVKELYVKYGYDEVMTPQIFNTELWKRSGHYDNYRESMYFIDVD
ncbi:MAG: threonine--tRNA ligase, partial [Chloroflexi bacterium]|nr:threonine--tRNA ligase [Chloroflexota bacterium]